MRSYIAKLMLSDHTFVKVDMLDYFDEEELHALPSKEIVSRFFKLMNKQYPTYVSIFYPNIWPEGDPCKTN